MGCPSRNTWFISSFLKDGKRILKFLKRNIVNKDWICAVRLCEADVLVHDGLVEWEELKQNTPGHDPKKAQKRALMTIKKCSRCGRTVQFFWSKERFKQWQSEFKKAS